MKRNREESGARNEEEERLRNREETTRRSRQWEVVGSDDEAEESSGDQRSDEDSDTSSEKHEKNEKEAKHGSSSSKHKHKHQKEDKKHSKKEKKSKKEKEKHHKHSHKHSHSEKEKKTSSKAVDQNEFGKFGIIREQDFFRMQREFEAYMEEVKHMPAVLGQGKREVMEHFRGFMEDFNTATLPHRKYYNLESWEMEEYKRTQLEKQQQRQSDNQVIRDTFNDEEERRAELKRQKLLKEHREFVDIKSKLTRDTSQRENMRRQEELRLQLQLAHKQGDRATVERLERLLAPEEEKMTVKHPWA